MMVAEAGGLEGLLRLMATGELPRKEAAVDALATLTSGSDDMSRRVADSAHVTSQLLPLLKSPSARVRFLAACCLTNLAPALPSTSSAPSQSEEVIVPQNSMKEKENIEESLLRNTLKAGFPCY